MSPASFPGRGGCNRLTLRPLAVKIIYMNVVLVVLGTIASQMRMIGRQIRVPMNEVIWRRSWPKLQGSYDAERS